MTEETAAGPQAVRAPRFGLSAKLLVLTILFVMIAEVLIYVPLIANFRVNWLRDHLAGAYTAALVLEAAPSGMVPDSLAKQILDSIGARAVAMKMGTRRRQPVVQPVEPELRHRWDIDQHFRDHHEQDRENEELSGKPEPRHADWAGLVVQIGHHVLPKTETVIINRVSVTNS